MKSVLEDSEEFNHYDEDEYFDWYDYEEIEKLNEKHSRQWIKLYKKIKDASEKGGEKAMAKAREVFRKHEEKGRKYKQKATAAGYCWV